MFALDPNVKKDPTLRWALPDRVFFGHGACHILAGAYLRRSQRPGLYAERIVPGPDFSGNHIFVTDGVLAFDYHGYALRRRLLDHHIRTWTSHCGDGWTCRLERVEFDLLCTEDLNSRKMLEPDQYLHDPIPRAVRFIDRFAHHLPHRSQRPHSRRASPARSCGEAMAVQRSALPA